MPYAHGSPPVMASDTEINAIPIPLENYGALEHVDYPIVDGDYGDSKADLLDFGDDFNMETPRHSPPKSTGIGRNLYNVSAPCLAYLYSGRVRDSCRLGVKTIVKKLSIVSNSYQFI
jgi:hypothetical protein